MNYIDFNKPQKVHFIGIGGISMSGFAEMLHAKGFSVCGSDAHKSTVTEHLEALGIKIYFGNRASNIEKDTQVVVYTAAISHDNPELVAARTFNIPVIDRAQLVGDITLQYKNNICIAGTHGKTTTTSLLSLILLEADMDPTISVGGILDAINGNCRLGASENFVLESCEYKDSFLQFNPTRALILNIEAEHLDYFKDIETERRSFQIFAEKIPNDGALVVNTGISAYRELFRNVKCPIVTYSLPGQASNDEEPDFTATDIAYNEYGCGQYTLIHKGNPLCHITLGVVGEHNLSNSIGAIALAYTMGIDLKPIMTACHKFTGTERRFEKKGVVGGVTIIDDYAHHPSEIAVTLKAAKSYPHKTLWCVFQPHTYSRTKIFLHEISEALSLADKIVLADIYAAREENPGDISSKDIADILSLKYGKEVYYFSSFGEIEELLLQKCCADDLLITMGAGDIVSIGEFLLGE